MSTAPKKAFFFSIVGQRPAAVAVTAKTLNTYLKNENPNLQIEARLFATPSTSKFSAAVKAFLQESLGWSVSLTTNRTLDNHIIDQIKSIFQSDPETPIFYNVSGGPSFVAARVSLGTISVSSLRPIFSEARRLIFISPPDNPSASIVQRDLQDIGMDQLLSLHELIGEYKSISKIRNTECYFDFRVKNKSALTCQALVACEKKGDLYIMIDISGRKSRKYYLRKNLNFFLQP